MKFKHNIYLVVFLCSFIPVCLWMVFTMYDTKSRTEKIIIENIEAIAGSQVMSIQNFCEGRMESMATIAENLLVVEAVQNYGTQGSSERLNAYLKNNEKNKTYVASISVVTADFYNVGSSERFEEGSLSNFRFSETENHSGEFSMGNAYIRETDKGEKRIIPAVIGIYDNGKLIGYLIQEIDCDYFNRLRIHTDFLEDGTLYLLDGEEQIITAGSPSESESRSDKVTTPEERQSYIEAWNAFDHENNTQGKIEYKFQGDTYVTYFSDIQYTDWTIRITENMSAQWKSKQSIYIMLLLEAAVAFALLGMVQLMVTRRLVAPLNKIVGTLKDIQAKHDYSLRTGVRRNDEVGVVADGIDELLDYIEQEELAEKRRHREFAEEALRKAEASNQAKSAFLFNASHDIRTPMNAIKGFTQIIEDNPDNPELILSSVGKIKMANEALMTLLNNVLELSKIESGKDVQEISTVNLNELTERLNIMFSEEMEKAGIRFTMENDLTDSLVLADEPKCTRILMNMLSNARKFTPSGGSVSFGIKQQRAAQGGCAEYYFFVKDTGIGMSEEFQKKAFEQFEMERTSTESGQEGSGLGLAIIKRFVEQMGGSCKLVSAPEKGTEISAALTLEIAREKPQKPQPTAANADFSGKICLMVEDNELNREIARYILEDAGIIVEEAEDGAVALERLSSTAPDYFDFILMDIQMPNMDGYEATRQIRAMSSRRLAEIPIIAMTANAFREDAEKCLEVGMNAHIAKPFEPERLFAVLKDLLKK